MSPRPRSPEKAREIIAAATGLFAGRGFDAVTVADVATAAGVGLSTLYLRFPSKQALGGAVFRQAKLSWARAVLDQLPADVPAAEQFAAYWDRMAAFTEREPATARYLTREPAPHEIDAEGRRYRRQLEQRTGAIVRGWMEHGPVQERPMMLVAALVHGPFWEIVQMPVTAEQRRTLLAGARSAVWQALISPDDGLPSGT